MEGMSAEVRKKITELVKKGDGVVSEQDLEADLKQMQKKVANVRWPVKDEQVLEHLRLAQDQGERREGRRS